MSEQRPSFLAVRVQNTGQVFALGRTPLTIGRQPDNTIVLPDSLVSRQHARIEWQPDGPVIHDLGSTHGTYLNGQRISGSGLLQPGHMLRVGNTILAVEGLEQPAAIAAPGPLPVPRTRPRTPGWLLMAGVALGLVAALALLLAAGDLFRPDAGDAGTVLPGDAQGEETAFPTLLPTASPAVVAEIEAALPTPTVAPPTAEPTAAPPTAELTAAPPTAEPTAAPPTAAPTVAPPTAAPPTNTTVPDYPAPSLVAPAEDQTSGVRGHVTFDWSYPRALNAGEGFQVLIWKEGQEHNGAAGLTRETQQTIDLDAVLPARGGGGDYFWTVVVRQDAPGERLLGPEADPWHLVYAPNEPASSPNQCTLFTCEGCDSWNSDNPLCTECQCP
jgi:hypothetical protein